MLILRPIRRPRTLQRRQNNRLQLELLEERLVLAATHLAITAQPPASVTAGSAFSVSVSAEDDTNTVDTTFTGAVTINLNGAGTLNGTLVVNAVDGVANFSSLSINTAAIGDTITATASPLTSATTNAFDVTGAAATTLVVTTQPPSSVAAGASFGLTVSAEDAFGNVSPAFTGAVTLSLNGAGTLNGTLTGNANAGVANFSGLSINQAGTGYTITATDDQLSPVNTTAFDVTASSASQFVITTQPPSSVVAGAPFGVTISATDAQGNVDTSYTGPITLALNGGGALNGTLTVNATAGVSTFTGLSINQAGTGKTISATGTGITTATTNTIDVTAAAASQLLMSLQPPASINQGTPFALTLVAQDAFGNVDTSFAGPITLLLNGAGTLGGTLTTNAVAGIAGFNNLTIDTAGTGDTISASSTGLTSVTSAPFDVVSTAATKLLVTAQPPISVVPNAPFSLTISATNANGVVDTTYTGPVTVALNGTGTLGGTLVVNAVAGVATFNGLTVSQAGTGDTITATATGLGSVTTNAFNVESPLTISGFVFVDLAASGTLANGDPAISGRVVYVDVNNDGIAQTSEPQATTDSTGKFSIGGFVPGTYSLKVVTYPGETATGATGGTRTVVLSGTTSATNQNFGIQQGSTILPKTPSADPFGGTTTTNDAIITSLYRVILGRNPDAAGLSDWQSRVAQGTSINQVTLGFYNSVEYRTILLNSYYQTYLHRAGETAGLQFWMSELMAGASPESVAQGFLGSVEYSNLHSTNDSFVTSLAQDVLGRNPTSNELSAWDQELASGLSRSALSSRIAQSTESYLRSINSNYVTILGRLADTGGADFWLNSVSEEGLTLPDIASGFFGSSEFRQRATRTT